MAKSLDEKILNEWLGEHGPYEVCMARYCLDGMLKATEQLAYNAHYEAFVVHARLLVDFFTGRQKKDDLKATVYSASYRAPKREHLNKAMEKVDQQVFHPTAKRTLSRADKVDLDDCIAISKWIELALEQFLEALSSTKHSGIWASEKARDDLIVRLITVSPAAPSASSSDPQTSTTSFGAESVYIINGNGKV